MEERYLKSDGARFVSASLFIDVGVAWLRFYLALTDKDLIENLSKSKKPKLDLVFEEWDVAGLPWWFLGNLRSNYKSRSNGSTDIQTNQVCRHFKEVHCILFLSSSVFQVIYYCPFSSLPASGFSASPFCVPVPAFHIRWLVTFIVFLNKLGPSALQSFDGIAVGAPSPCWKLLLSADGGTSYSCMASLQGEWASCCLVRGVSLWE